METAMSRCNSSLPVKLAQVKVSVDSGIAAAFKAACAASNVSMAAELSRFMADYANCPAKRTATPNYSTRRHRRTAIRTMVKELERMRACEERVLDNCPENLLASSVYEATEEAISSLDAGIDALSEY